MTKHTLSVLALTATALLASPPLSAQLAAPSVVEPLSRCLADNTSGRDRKDLARWVFLAMAAHPEIERLTSADVPAAVAETDKTTAAIFTRLLAETCVNQTRAAMKQGGSVAIEAAFTTLGQLAMKELMSDPKVNGRMSNFQQHIDQPRLNQALTGP